MSLVSRNIMFVHMLARVSWRGVSNNSANSGVIKNVDVHWFRMLHLQNVRKWGQRYSARMLLEFR